MKVVVSGASGATGRELVNLAEREGRTVTAFAGHAASSGLSYDRCGEENRRAISDYRKFSFSFALAQSAERLRK